MELNALIAECSTYDFKLLLEEKKPKSWLKSVSAFANGLGGSLLFGIMGSEVHLDINVMAQLDYMEKRGSGLTRIFLPLLMGQMSEIMSEMMSVSQRTIEREISLLKKLGVLRREGNDKDGMWVLNE